MNCDWPRQESHRKSVANERAMRSLEREASNLKTDFMTGKISREQFIATAKILAAELDAIGYAFHPCNEPYGGFYNVFAHKKSKPV